MIKWRRMRWAGHVACVGYRRGAYRVLVGKPEGKIPLGKHRHRWEGNIKMNFKEVGWTLTGPIWLRIRDRWRAGVNAVTNLRVT
jgi:hypothetical protein